MGRSEERKVGERGQITIPKWIREKEGIEGGDEVLVKEKGGAIVIEKSREDLEERLKEGYVATAEQAKEINREMTAASTEARERLEDEG